MDKLIQFLDGFNIQTILSMAVILWYFTRDIRNEIKKEIEAIRQENTTQANRSDRLYEMFNQSLLSMRKEVDEQSKRSDRLYEMFIKLLTEKK